MIIFGHSFVLFVAVFCSKEWSLELVIVKVLHHWTWLLRTGYLMLIFTIQVTMYSIIIIHTCR